MGDAKLMIRKGTIVRRKPNDFCSLSLALRYDVLTSQYPPPDSLCVVTSNPKEVDLSSHDRNYNSKTSIIILKKGVEVICDGKWYGPCDINAFKEVKKKDDQ